MAAFNCHLLKKLLIMLIATNIKQKKTAKQIFETVFLCKISPGASYRHM